MRELTDALSERKYNDVIVETWGHLAPKRQTKYRGEIVFTHSDYGGEILLITSNFDGLDDSPWFFRDMNEFICNQKTEPGNVYRFRGTYILHKNGNCHFAGNVQKVTL